MVEICALASGSNGNCYYIGNETSAVLIDAGISTKQILLRMQYRHLDPSKIKAVFITHEHTDHSKGVRVLSNRLGIPAYMTKGTYLSIRTEDRPSNSCFVNDGEELEVEGFKIYPFLKNHDAAEPCSFRVRHGQTNIGVFTDIGEACENVKDNLKLCRAVFLESNYDEEMLWEGPYPYYLKQRVASSVGHMSNMQALQLIESFAGDDLEYVFLSHLSKENNTPKKAYDIFRSLNGRFNVQLTSREEATEVFRLK